jgi:hypothetical protein
MLKIKCQVHIASRCITCAFYVIVVWLAVLLRGRSEGGSSFKFRLGDLSRLRILLWSSSAVQANTGIVAYN